MGTRVMFDMDVRMDPAMLEELKTFRPSSKDTMETIAKSMFGGVDEDKPTDKE